MSIHNHSKIIKVVTFFGGEEVGLCTEPRAQIWIRDIGFLPLAASSKTNILFAKRPEPHSVGVYFL